MRSFGFRQWLVVAAFLLVLGFTSFYVYHAVRGAVYWRVHQDEPIQGWMTVGHVAHSYHVPPHVLYSALGLPNKPPDKRPLGRIAKAQNRSINDLRAELLAAIARARASSTPSTLPANNEGALE